MTTPSPLPGKLRGECILAPGHAGSCEFAASPLPTDEDREALASIITWTDWPDWNNLTVDQGEIIADAILAAGFRRSVVSTPDFCDECAGPYGGWLRHYNGHWDTCPNRAVGAIAPFAARLRQSADRLVSEPEAHRLMYEAAEMAETLEYSAVSAPPTITDEMVERAAFASFALDGGSERSRSIWHAMSADARESARVSARAALRAALGGEA